ncbi:hypothetical protein [Gordonia sp. SMJS1]|uniref:hypothetical protein n=1 Tax=Gordonia sp. SMJS1 TaxID=3039400 RepID=UPI00245751AA|nr:hypothetical protein [Gordonia sp. SMJS1]WGJ88029.1 hypothetical protein QAD21_24260 [Gordonia sp. SMJS1]
MAQDLYASWTHGTAAVAESPKTEALPQGFGTTFTLPLPRYQSGDVFWYYFHIPIPTPVIIGSAGRPKLQRVILQFRMVGHGTITQIHLYDGPTLVFKTPATLDLWEVDRTATPYVVQDWGGRSINKEIRYGLGVTLKVRVVADYDNRPGKLFIAGAGGDFLTQ